MSKKYTFKVSITPWVGTVTSAPEEWLTAVSTTLKDKFSYKASIDIEPFVSCPKHENCPLILDSTGHWYCTFCVEESDKKVESLEKEVEKLRHVLKIIENVLENL